MRAQNQQDLIYKRGQAGITKASVTIVFDNSDREKSPVGLENCKQITVTRQARILCDPASGQPCDMHYNLDRTSQHIQISTQWSQVNPTERADPLSKRSTQYQQSQLSHHARSYHQSPEYAPPGDPWHGRRGFRYSYVRRTQR